MADREARYNRRAAEGAAGLSIAVECPFVPDLPAKTPDFPRGDEGAHADGSAQLGEGSIPSANAVEPVVPPDLPAEEETGRRWKGWIPDGETVASCITSAVLHASLLVILALAIEAAGRTGSPEGTLTAEMLGPAESENLETEPFDSPLATAPETGGQFASLPIIDAPALEIEPAVTSEEPVVAPSTVADVLGAKPDDLLLTPRPEAGSLGNRGARARAALLGEGDGGPSRQSEAAVEAGLRWLAAHQLEDGGWHFDHRKSWCKGQCRNPGKEPSTTGATGLSLLAFLGAGYTHREGEHRRVIRDGIYYLERAAMQTPNGLDLQEGTMYAQGIATLALCEAYALTQDPALKDLAQRSVDFIVYAQDKQGGGWRYTPGSRGDTTVTGWQVMALKSGRMSGLSVPRSTWYLVEKFLDSVQADQGAVYGYLDPEPRPSCTAIGLLCRMYDGWQPDRPALARGVKLLSDVKPSPQDVYFNYYATQVMFHWGGSDWKRWNRTLREYLVKTQATEGHESGSWYFEDPHARSGGRLYCTAMSVMTLEVYYRYLPIYDRGAVEGRR